MADEVNAACDAGRVPAGGRHSGVFPPVKAEYILPSLEKFCEKIYRISRMAESRIEAVVLDI